MATICLGLSVLTYEIHGLAQDCGNSSASMRKRYTKEGDFDYIIDIMLVWKMKEIISKKFSGYSQETYIMRGNFCSKMKNSQLHNLTTKRDMR